MVNRDSILVGHVRGYPSSCSDVTLVTSGQRVATEMGNNGREKHGETVNICLNTDTDTMHFLLNLFGIL